MVIAIAHDVNTKEGHVSIAAKLNSNFDGKLMLPSQGNPVATLVGSHRWGAWVLNERLCRAPRIAYPRPQLGFFMLLLLRPLSPDRVETVFLMPR